MKNNLNNEQLNWLLSMIRENSAPQEVNKNVDSFIDALYFGSYLESEGFNANNYNQILELNQNVIGSISLFLERYQQFLLSDNLSYGQLHTVGLNGGRGHLTGSGIYIPKSVDSDNHFLHSGLPKVPYTRHVYEYPKIDDTGSEYDIVISKGLSNHDNVDLALRLGLDFIFGDTLKMDSPNYKMRRDLLVKQLELINLKTTDEGQLVYDTLQDVEYIALKRIR